MTQRYHIRHSATDRWTLQLQPAPEDTHIIARGILLQYQDMSMTLVLRIYPDPDYAAEPEDITCRVYVNGYKVAQASMAYDFLPTYIERVIKDRAVLATYAKTGKTPPLT